MGKVMCVQQYYNIDDDDDQFCERFIRMSRYSGSVPNIDDRTQLTSPYGASVPVPGMLHAGISLHHDHHVCLLCDCVMS